MRGKRVGYGYLYNWYAVDTGVLAPYAGDDGLVFTDVASDYNELEGYPEGVYVFYLGDLYVSIQEVPEGVNPTNTNYWEEVPYEEKGTHPYTDNGKVVDGYDIYTFYDWNIPTDAQWTELENHIGADPGWKLKSTLNEWGALNTGATDQYNFAALPGGLRSPTGSFSGLGSFGTWWTATETSSTTAWSRSLAGSLAGVDRLNDNKRYGLSVRCIQVKPPGEADGTTGTLTDIDGNIYTWVTIGNYRWMAENLRTTKDRNGVDISHAPYQTNTTPPSNMSLIYAYNDGQGGALINPGGYIFYPYQGEWSSSVEYELDDYVFHDNGFFLCVLKPNQGHTPSFEFVQGSSRWLPVSFAYYVWNSLAGNVITAVPYPKAKYCAYNNDDYFIFPPKR